MALLWPQTPSSAGPLSERIVLVAPYRGLSKLFISRSDGRDLQRLGDVTGDLREPSYSPALDRIFFTRERDRRSEIWSCRLDGSDPQRHLFSEVANYSAPDISPDGRLLAAQADLWGSLELVQLRLEDGQIQRLTYDQGTNTHPRFSPDGRRLLFLSRRSGHSNLYTKDMETGEVQRITRSSFNEGPGWWSSDGSRLVTTRAVPPMRRPRLLELDLESGRERLHPPTDVPVRSPVYSPDDSRILFLQEAELMLWDLSDPEPKPYPLRGTLEPTEAIWFVLPSIYP